jgi:predicted Zn-dependent protease
MPAHTRRALTLAATLLALAGCASSGVNKGQLNVISLEQEWQLGDQLAGDLSRQLRLVDDPAAQSYVESVGRAIVGQTEMANLPWHFHIVADPEVNAFSIPGGHVYVNTGLIAAAPTAAAFAGTLAHECSHVVARHATEQLSRQYGIEAVGAVLLGQNPTAYQQILASLASQGAMARFSRADEAEADRLGARYMLLAGYDPHGLVDMFRTLLAERQSRPGSVERFFATHPLTEDRIRAVEKEIAAFPASSGDLIATDPGFRELQAHLAAGGRYSR